PPWSPRAVTVAVAVPASPGAGCSPGPLTTNSAPSCHRHQTPAVCSPTETQVTAAFFIASSTSGGTAASTAPPIPIGSTAAPARHPALTGGEAGPGAEGLAR